MAILGIVAFPGLVAGQCGDVTEPNGTCLDAYSLNCNTVADPPVTPTCIFDAGELDYFVFAGSAGDLLTATVSADVLSTGLDAMLALLDVVSSF